MRAAAMALASSFAFLPLAADAASLGRLTVLSPLGQPLRAEIELRATPAELTAMSARLAPQEAFRQAGVEFISPLLDLRFSVERGASGANILRINSSRPIHEPFLDFLIELNWANGRLVREYTFLLDPIETAKPSSAGSNFDIRPVENLPVAAPKEQSAPIEPAKERVDAKATAIASGGKHTVHRGETLHQIAAEKLSHGVSLEQMLVGLHRANPDAFIDGNINRVKTGAILNVPAPEALTAVPQMEAEAVYRTYISDWNAYRQKLAAGVGRAQAGESQGGQSAGGRIVPRVEEKAAPASAKQDRLKIARTEGTERGTGGKAAEENAIAREKALKEAQERVSVLEKNVGELQKLVEMKNQSLAELRKRLAAKDAQPVTPVAPVAPAAVATPEKAPVEEARKPAEEAKNAAESAKPAETAKPAEPQKPADAEAAKPKGAVPDTSDEEEVEPSLIDELLANPLALGGLGALLAVLLALVLRRKKPVAQPLHAVAPTLGEAQGADSDSMDSETPSEVLDPLAEAEVYLTNGRDVEAEEILLEALRSEPERLELRSKLLEIYAQRRSVDPFAIQAGELYALTQGVGPVWEAAAALGRGIDPENPLYGGSAAEATALPFPDPDDELAALLGEAEPLEPPRMTPSVPVAADGVQSDAAADNVPTLDIEEDVDAVDDAAVLDFDVAAVPSEPLTMPAAKMAQPVEASSEAPDALVDFDMDTESEVSSAPAKAVPPGFDISSINLDLSAEDGEVQDDTAMADTAPVSAVAAPVVRDAHWEEVNTKLDLAKAYQEMGDLEGARELLAEVVSEGPEDLVEQAEKILSRLDA